MGHAVLAFLLALFVNVLPYIFRHLIGLCFGDAFHKLSGHGLSPLFVVTVKG
jgi:hypothetical protein